MTFLDSIEAYLEDKDIGVVGETIFDSELPFDGDNIISLVLAPSPSPNKSIPYYIQTVDIWARFSDFDSGYSKLQEVFGLFHGQENYELTGYHIYVSSAIGMIEDLDRDTERRHIFKLSLSFIYRTSGGS